MPRLPFRIALFLSSYSPLFGLLAWTNRSYPRTWLALASLAGASVVALVIVLAGYRSEHGAQLVVTRSVPKDGDVMAYVATYLVPFFALHLNLTDDRVVLGVFLVVLGVVYVNSNMLFVNPLLSLAGFHTFEVTDAAENEYTLITRHGDVEPGAVITPAEISRYLRLEVRRVRT